MKYNGTTVPTTRDNTYNSEEIHRKDDTELFETAFNKDQKTFLSRLTGAISEIRESILGILPSVSSDDNGKVLTVVNGAWDKASSSGGGGLGCWYAEYDAETDVGRLFVVSPNINGTSRELVYFEEACDALSSGSYAPVHGWVLSYVYPEQGLIQVMEVGSGTIRDVYL